MMKALFLTSSLLSTIAFGAIERPLKDVFSREEAEHIFKDLKKKECFRQKRQYIATEIPVQSFERSHVWAYDMEKQLGVKSEKLFIFFTKKYRYGEGCRFPYKFKTAPAIKVEEDGIISTVVLDNYMTMSPASIQEWATSFITRKTSSWLSKGCDSLPKDIHCPVIELKDYTGYENYPHHHEDYCFVVKTPSYYFYEKDLEDDSYLYERDLEDENSYSSDWRSSDLRRAYSQVVPECGGPQEEQDNSGESNWYDFIKFW